MHLKDGIASEPMLIKVFLIVLVLILSVFLVPVINYVQSHDIKPSDNQTLLYNESLDSNSSFLQNKSNHTYEIEQESKMVFSELRYDCQIDFKILSEKTGLSVDDIKLLDTNNDGFFDTLGGISNNFSKKISELDIEVINIDYKNEFLDFVRVSDDYSYGFFYTNPINFFNESSNSFEPIDISVVKTSLDGFLFKNVRNNVKTFFGSNGEVSFNKNSLNFFSNPVDQYFSSINFDSNVTVSGNSIVYSDFYDDVDLRYQVFNGFVSEEFVLKKAIDLKNISIDIVFEEPVSFRYRSDGSLSFYDKESGTSLFVIDKPFMWEEYNPRIVSYDLFYDVEKINNLTFRINKVFTDEGIDWLNNADRSYPVVVDPTYNFYSNKSYDGFVSISGENWSGIRNSVSGSIVDSSSEFNDSAVSASNNSLFSISRSFFAFNTSNLSSNAIINNVSFFIHGYGSNESRVMAQEWTSVSSDLGLDDYSALDLDGSSFGNTSTWVIDGYNRIDFDSLGIDSINKDGFTYLVLREYDHDYSNVTPEGSNSNGLFFSDDSMGSSRHPYLQINFTLDTTAPSTTINHPENINYINSLDNITGTATDNIQVSNVTLRIHDLSIDKYWTNPIGVWDWFSLEELDGKSSWFNVTVFEGIWGDKEVNWYYNCSSDGLTWTNNNFYNISAKAWDGVNSDPNPAYENFWYDNQTPSSELNKISPYLQKFSPITITATASDAGVNASGIKNLTLWYRYSNDNNSWDQWTEYQTIIEEHWEWSFSFPGGDGYYEFYSIATDNAYNIETKTFNDTICRYDSKIAPVINSVDLRNNTGSKINNVSGLLDINEKYFFEINVTDENGWADIKYINITAWFDNGCENSYYNQTLGGNINMFLQYENTTGVANYNLLWPNNEIELILDDCSETVISPDTRIIRICFIPKNQIRWAESNKTWIDHSNSYDNLYSWNFNITVVDQTGLKDYYINEFGVSRFTYIQQERRFLDVTLAPGYSANTNTITIDYSSNYDYIIKVYFENDLINSTSKEKIAIENNVQILASGDTSDDIDIDQTFKGIGLNNAIEVINNSGVFQKNNSKQSISFKFSVNIPLGTYSGTYTSRLAIIINQK